MVQCPQQRLQPGQNLPVSSHHHIEMLPPGRVRSAAQPCWCHGPGAASKQTPKCPGSIRDLIFTAVSLLMLSLMGLTGCNIAQKVPVSGFPERTSASQLRRQRAMPPALPAMSTAATCTPGVRLCPACARRLKCRASCSTAGFPCC